MVRDVSSCESAVLYVGTTYTQFAAMGPWIFRIVGQGVGA
ncbi:hypothetical protein K788_0005253 [Paraburkholderia caribensis MBA4]|uniref:Uncharacterized protein n=1 Tax=Paraburkholderia caribensis MBA4 TaxID=1323664 RepID=A0A0P0RFI2_9BURK|nr:hypothetical protein K788_0005253 [Paraburkholderia caribensis MBA4]